MAKGKGDPRFNSKKTRVQVALAKHHGMGDEGQWTIPEIAEYLNVSETTVEDYLYDTDIAEEVESQLADTQARTRMRIGMKLMNYLDRLEKLENELGQEKRPAVVSHRMETVKGEVSMNKEGMQVTDEREVAFDVPVPDQFKEVTKVDDLQDVWTEKRQIIQQLEDLLGLESPEEMEVEQTVEKREIKLWGGLEDADFPEGEVLEGAEADAIEVEGETEDSSGLPESDSS